MTTPTPIDIPFLSADNLELRLTVGACKWCPSEIRREQPNSL